MSEWRKQRISDFCDITRGGSPRPIQDYLSSSGTPWVKISDATASNNRYISSTKEFIRVEGEAKSRVVNPGDFILSNSATPGLPRFMKIRACIHDGWLLIRNIKGVDELFLYYLLLTEREALLVQGNGSIFTNLKTEILKEHTVNLPPHEEQNAIASVLSSLDNKIDLLHRQNNTLERIAETLFRQWFVEEAQEDWKAGTLKDEFDFTMGQSPAGSSFNQEGIGIAMFQGNADFGFRFPTERVYTTEPARFAEPMDTLISVRAPVGAQNMAKVKCCIGRGVAAFRYKINADFYTYTYFKLRSLMEDIKQFNDEGTVFGSISKTDFENLVTTIPNDEDVLNFEREAKPVNDKIINNCEQIQTLEKLRDNLLPKLMSGEIRVILN
ncbi:MAG: restriction endonuclease subunit S [Methylotenera sp.]|nr:restriction endonuclease subunit S [Methylotenera sp.]MDD4927424.1 restriction endonuclease subunit S [Methylotenera sp.]